MVRRYLRHDPVRQNRGCRACISYPAQSIVYNLVVDDVRDRGHRRNVMMTEFHEAGVSYGSHPKYGVVCVIDFAGGFNR